MVNITYIPDRGDLVWLSFSPQTGREQSGRRPAVVLSPKSYNRLAGLAIFCPITNQQKGYPFEVVLGLKSKISGVIIADHVKSLDWKERKAKFITKIGNDVMSEIFAKLHTLI